MIDKEERGIQQIVPLRIHVPFFFRKKCVASPYICFRKLEPNSIVNERIIPLRIFHLISMGRLMDVSCNIPHRSVGPRVSTIPKLMGCVLVLLDVRYRDIPNILTGR